MSPRLDLPLAVAVWLSGFGLLAWTGSWLPLAGLAALAAGRLVFLDAGTRGLLLPTGLSIALGLGGAAVMVAATYLLFPLVVRVVPELRPATAELYRLLDQHWPRPALAGLLLLVSASEEILWRGRALSSGPKWEWARILGCTALYSAAHAASGSMLLVALALVCGLFWAALRLWGRSLIAPILAHAAWDLLVMGWLPLV